MNITIRKDAGQLWDLLPTDILALVNESLRTTERTVGCLADAAGIDRPVALALFLMMAAREAADLFTDVYASDGTLVESRRMREGLPHAADDDLRFDLRVVLREPVLFERDTV